MNVGADYSEIKKYFRSLTGKSEIFTGDTPECGFTVKGELISVDPLKNRFFG